MSRHLRPLARSAPQQKTLLEARSWSPQRDFNYLEEDSFMDKTKSYKDHLTEERSGQWKGAEQGTRLQLDWGEEVHVEFPDQGT